VRAELDAYAPDDPAQQQLKVEFLSRLDAGAVRRAARPDHLTASAVVLDASRTHVLLVLHGKVRRWLQPGGHVEDGDTTLSQAALRETLEETGVVGLELVATTAVHLDRHAAPCGARHHLDVCFLVQAPDGAVPITSEESLDVRWFPVDALPAQEPVGGHVIDLGPWVRAGLRA